MNIRGFGVIHLNKTGICVASFLVVILFYYLFSGKSFSSVENGENRKINLRKLLWVAVKAAENGGVEIIAAKDDLKVESKGKTKEGLNDTVTTADYKSHCSMQGTIKHFFPSVHMKSEEVIEVCDLGHALDFGGVVDGKINHLNDVFVDEKDVIVWIDPLDATKEYTEKLYEYVTTMVCVAVNGKAIIGVIHKPFTQDTSWSWVNNDCSDNLKEHKKANNSNLKIIISRSHSGQIKEKLEEHFKSSEIITAAGSGYKVLEVIAGNADAYVHNTAIKKWDICAGNALLNAVNGTMSTKDNELIDYSDTVNVVNENGLIATMHNHDMFVGKL